MRIQKSKVIIDTNLWISFLLTNDLSILDTLISGNKIALVFSQELIDEFVEVSQRNKFRKYFALDDVENLLIKIRSQALLITVKSKVEVCRDGKDDFLLALAIDGKATHLITGDKDLLVLKKYGDTKILTINEYLSEMDVAAKSTRAT
ncbi:MAG TPA: putative toxin-antitoxin system toxin component, PIN family [Mucilaginibacter sp.]|jgi:putative PIN family toxin of toxin-antitoxin system|nr:putative toxin-antitoxin system toxin component, PIN family [Mucilaginibacter sp.]